MPRQHASFHRKAKFFSNDEKELHSVASGCGCTRGYICDSNSRQAASESGRAVRLLPRHWFVERIPVVVPTRSRFPSISRPIALKAVRTSAENSGVRPKTQPKDGISGHGGSTGASGATFSGTSARVMLWRFLQTGTTAAHSSTKSKPASPPQQPTPFARCFPRLGSRARHQRDGRDRR